MGVEPPSLPTNGHTPSPHHHGLPLLLRPAHMIRLCRPTNIQTKNQQTWALFLTFLLTHWEISDRFLGHSLPVRIPALMQYKLKDNLKITEAKDGLRHSPTEFQLPGPVHVKITEGGEKEGRSKKEEAPCSQHLLTFDMFPSSFSLTHITYACSLCAVSSYLFHLKPTLGNQNLSLYKCPRLQN